MHISLVNHWLLTYLLTEDMVVKVQALHFLVRNEKSQSWRIKNQITLLYISSGIILINELLDHCGTSYEIASLFGITFGTVAALIKISLLNVNHKNILYIVLNVVDDWWKVEDEKSKNIMRENSSWNGMLFYGILTPLLLYTSKFVIESIPHTIITDDNATIYVRTTPMSSDCWNLADIPTVIYLIRFACRTVEFIVYNITSCGIDLYFLVLASHICGQIEINNMNIKNFFVDRKGVFKRDYFYKIIYRQKHLLDMMDKLRESFNYTTLAVLIISGIHLNIMSKIIK
ncbi:hypothetical protein KQX54_016780 [Cotesia glomerata]|uniref:Odorant receptor n=1 Tax=Cotesia glomerata TaxID=32391 RepID=A0AAV7I1W1_COTGL|nr:hypothetical protein KQX54_016780 [Cotesia glomerata]